MHLYNYLHSYKSTSEPEDGYDSDGSKGELYEQSLYALVYVPFFMLA